MSARGIYSTSSIVEHQPPTDGTPCSFEISSLIAGWPSIWSCPGGPAENYNRHPLRLLKSSWERNEPGKDALEADDALGIMSFFDR